MTCHSVMYNMFIDLLYYVVVHHVIHVFSIVNIIVYLLVGQPLNAIVKKSTRDRGMHCLKVGGSYFVSVQSWRQPLIALCLLSLTLQCI